MNFANIISIDGMSLSWVEELRHSGVHISSEFKWSSNYVMRAFYCALAADAIFGKMAEATSEKVVLQIVTVHVARFYSTGLMPAYSIN